MITAKAVIFDTDGTLIDTIKRFYIAFNQLLKEIGKKQLAWEGFLEQYITDELDDVITLAKGSEREKALHEFWLEFLKRYRAIDVAEDRMIIGAKEALAKVHSAGIPIAVITSCITPADQLREELQSYGMDKFVGTIVTGADALEDLNKEHHFSKREIFKLAMEKLGVSPKDCVIVGDYWNDIRDGKAVGAKTVAVLTGLMRKELLLKFKPDALIESVRDLPKVVKFVVHN